MDNELEQLIKDINYHNKKYWVDGDAEISDSEYDILINRLKEIDPDNELISKIYKTNVKSIGKITHKTPMLSLDKAYSIEEIINWANKHIRKNEEEILIQPKYDGISANFEDGILATRGDGSIGEDISDKIEIIKVESPKFQGDLICCKDNIRGEIVIRTDEFHNKFQDLKKKDGKPYKNPRNAVAGIMGLKNIDNIKLSGLKLTLVDYDLISHKINFNKLKDNWDNLIEEMENLPYPMDGLVVKFADKKFAESLGNTAHHPRGQIAFKFTNIKKDTKLIDIEWSFGKNCLTPVAIFEPIEINGVEIKRATLHNAQNVLDKDIKIGDTITVERAGDVIPYITDRKIGEERKEVLIKSCPSCGEKLAWRGPELYCPNSECPETKLQKLVASIKSIGIERLGEPNVKKLVAEHNVTDLYDIFTLTKEQILKLDNFKEKSATNLYNEIQTAKDVDDHQLLTALNIPNVGKNVAKEILKIYSLNELSDLNEEELSNINGIGPERAKAIFNSLKANQELIEKLLTVLNVKESKGEEKKPTICFTGKMPEKRSFYEELAIESGFSPVKNINSELKVLVAMDKNGKSSKLKKATKLGIEILSLNEWLLIKDELINNLNEQESDDSKLPQTNEVENEEFNEEKRPQTNEVENDKIEDSKVSKTNKPEKSNETIELGISDKDDENLQQPLLF